MGFEVLSLTLLLLLFALLMFAPTLIKLWSFHRKLESLEDLKAVSFTNLALFALASNNDTDYNRRNAVVSAIYAFEKSKREHQGKPFWEFIEEANVDAIDELRAQNPEELAQQLEWTVKDWYQTKFDTSKPTMAGLVIKLYLIGEPKLISSDVVEILIGRSYYKALSHDLEAS